MLKKKGKKKKTCDTITAFFVLRRRLKCSREENTEKIYFCTEVVLSPADVLLFTCFFFCLLWKTPKMRETFWGEVMSRWHLGKCVAFFTFVAFGPVAAGWECRLS